MAGHALLVYADPTTLSAPTATVKNCAMDVLRNEADISMNKRQSCAQSFSCYEYWYWYVLQYNCMNTRA